ncbi:MAG TPA: inositol monophosphatase [Candidatus Saccharimonadales bacterium]
MNTSPELTFTIEITQEASEIFRRYFGNAPSTWKSDNTPVTQGDTEINDLIIKRINERFPNDEVLGEESSNTLHSRRVWVVDPIDGTQPFENGIPVSTIVIAAIEDGVVQLAVVYEPMLGDLYYAERGKGAYKNGVRIQCNTRDSAGQSYFATSSLLPVGYASVGEIHDKIERAKGKTFNFRSYTYSAMKVAEGRLCAATLGIGRPYDIAAPALIVEEAGGIATDLDGKPLDFSKGSAGIVVSNGPLHTTFLEYIQK